MANPEIPRGVLILILFGFPAVAIATARFGVGAALSAVAAYLFALGVAVVAVVPVDAMSVSKDLVVSVSAAAATVIAWKGLQTWKHQSRASRQADFLDELVEEAQRFVLSMSAPVHVVRLVRIGLRSYSDVPSTPPVVPWSRDLDFSLTGAATYIERHGEKELKRFQGLLGEANPHAVRLGALVNKGQVFGFDQYQRCQNASRLLLWQYARIEAFAHMLGSTTLNFAHPEVQESIQKALSLDASNVDTFLQEQIVELLEFSRSSYEQIYL